MFSFLRCLVNFGRPKHRVSWSQSILLYHLSLNIELHDAKQRLTSCSAEQCCSARLIGTARSARYPRACSFADLFSSILMHRARVLSEIVDASIDKQVLYAKKRRFCCICKRKKTISIRHNEWYRPALNWFKTIYTTEILKWAELISLNWKWNLAQHPRIHTTAVVRTRARERTETQPTLLMSIE